jgi:hypothetical protein
MLAAVVACMALASARPLRDAPWLGIDFDVADAADVADPFFDAMDGGALTPDAARALEYIAHYLASVCPPCPDCASFVRRFYVRT